MTTETDVEKLLYDLRNWNQLLRRYQVPSTSKALIQIANSFSFYIALCALQFYLYDYSFWGSLGVAVLNGFLLGRIFIIQHDCGHESFLRSRSANALVGTLCSALTLIPFRYWAKNHSFHHAHNGQLEHSDIGDVACLTAREYASLDWKGKIWYRVYRNPLYLFTIGGLVYVLLYNRFAFLKTDYFKKVRTDVTYSNLAFLGVYSLLALWLGPGRFLSVQFVNLFFFGTYALWFFYIQHQYEHIYKSGKDNWNYVVAALKGSTYYKLPRLMHWLTGNIGYHHIHHLSPAIPNYHLAQCHRDLSWLEKYTHTITFWDSLKTIHANLWDEQQKKMISFAEYRRNKNAYRKKSSADASQAN